MSKLQLEQFLPYRLARTAQDISIAYARVYEERFGISIAQWRIIAHLAEQGQLTAKQLSELSGLDKSKISRAVAELEQRELLVSRGSRSDRRAKTLRLSNAGIEVYEAMVPLALEWESALLDGVSANEYRVFLSVLEKLETKTPA